MQQYSKEHRETLRTQFCTALEGFKAVEKSVAEKERASLNKTAASQTSDDEWVLVSSQDIQQANGSPKLSQKHAEEKANARIELAMIQERHKDILKLEVSKSTLGLL